MANTQPTTDFRAMVAAARPGPGIEPGGHRYGVPVYATVPPGCGLHLIQGTRLYPLYRDGEAAVIDFDDRTFESGELYLLHYRSGARTVTQIWQCERLTGERAARIESDEPCVVMMPINRPRSIEETEQWLREGRRLHMSDGPLRERHLAAMILGRVIGLYQPEGED